jgi:hypothetical protein
MFSSFLLQQYVWFLYARSIQSCPAYHSLSPWLDPSFLCIYKSWHQSHDELMFLLHEWESKLIARWERYFFSFSTICSLLSKVFLSKYIIHNLYFCNQNMSWLCPRPKTWALTANKPREQHALDAISCTRLRASSAATPRWASSDPSSLLIHVRYKFFMCYQVQIFHVLLGKNM